MDFKVGDKFVADMVQDDQELCTHGFHGLTGVVTGCLPAPNEYDTLRDVCVTELSTYGRVLLYADTMRHLTKDDDNGGW